MHTCTERTHSLYIYKTSSRWRISDYWYYFCCCCLNSLFLSLRSETNTSTSFCKLCSFWTNHSAVNAPATAKPAWSWGSVIRVSIITCVLCIKEREKRARLKRETIAQRDGNDDDEEDKEEVKEEERYYSRWNKGTFRKAQAYICVQTPANAPTKVAEDVKSIL